MRGTRPLWPLLAAALTLGLARPCPAEADEPAPLPSKPLGDKEKGEAVPLLRNYLVDGHPERTGNRLEMKRWVERSTKAGVDPLADVPGLLDAIYKARPFEAAYDKKSLRDGKFEVDAVNRITSVQKDELKFSYSLPPKYPTDPRKAGTLPPFPTILTLHDLVDFEEGPRIKDFAGLEAIRRRYSRTGPLKAVTEEWMIFAPVSTKARFDGEVNRRIVGPFVQLWKRLHVDFDRVVLDGGDDVLSVAVSIPIFFCGVIVRGDPRDLDPKLAVNIAHLPIYVVGGDDAPAAKWLKAAGLSPTVGSADGVAEWLKATREKPRAPLTEFKWRVKDPKRQIVAHWINVNEAEPDSDLAVKVVKETNSIEITARGVADVGVFLNDRIVDLSKPVKLVLNGKEPKPPQTHARNLDVMFENEVVRIRSSGYYGWLYPVLLHRVKIPPPEAETTPGGDGTKEGAPKESVAAGGTEEGTPTGGQTAEERDAEAGVYFQKAEEAEKAGNLEKALTLFRKALGVGVSSFKAKAEEKIKELEAKVAPPSKTGSAPK